MSILIKGINMPKEPWECPCHNGENGNCNVTQKVCFEIPKDCPLVEVQTPHGDLIEREELFRLASKRLFPNIHIEQVRFIAYNMLPAIIESEE